MEKWFSEKTDYIIKELVKILLTVLIFSLASQWLFNTFNNYLVDKVLNLFYKEKLSLLETLLTFLLSFYTLYLLVVKYANTVYKLRFFTIFLMFFCTVVYFLCRFNNLYSYTRIFTASNSNGIAFLDVPFFLLSTIILVFIINRLNFNLSKPENDLIIDLPLEIMKDDEYDRTEVYEGLIDQIIEINFQEKKSFCLGIANSWGEGKTSFLNFLENRLSSDTNTIIIKFNPWLSINSDNLTLDFFQTFNIELSKYVYTGSDFRKYANNLTAINSVYNPFKYLPNSWIGDKSHQKSFEDINETIRKSGKRIFVFIDDLDRLDNKEVFNLLRTVRNTANFGNVHFVVPFDKSYVINAIRENKIDKPDEYIKKIFDVEIVLPPIPKYIIQNIFFSLFRDLFINKLKTTKEQLDGFLEQLNSIVYDSGHVTSHRKKYSFLNTILFKVLKNKRDILRFYNAFVLILKVNYSWTYFPDLLILEILKMNDKDIYRALFENDHYLNSASDDNGRLYYLLKEGDEENDTLDFVEQVMARKKDEYVIIDRIDDEDITRLIKDLFSLPDEDDFMAKFGIAYQSNFANYFQYRENGIKFNDIDDFLNGE